MMSSSMHRCDIYESESHNILNIGSRVRFSGIESGESEKDSRTRYKEYGKSNMNEDDRGQSSRYGNVPTGK